MKIIIDIPQGLKIDFENENWTALTCAEMKNALMQGKLLTKEPCDDCISRQAVLEYIEGSEAELGHSSENELVCQDIKALPSVTPQPKMGKWINDKCSICGKGIEDLIDSREWYENERPNFCPFCGVKIEAESEG